VSADLGTVRVLKVFHLKDPNVSFEFEVIASLELCRNQFGIHPSDAKKLGIQK